MENRIPRLLRRVESLTRVDRPAAQLRQWYDRTLPRGRARQVLAGAPLGHPMHPALVLVPIGSWTSAAVLDLVPGQRAAARRLVGLGVLTAAPSLVAGAIDYQELTTTQQRRVGFVHAVSNMTATWCYAASYLARRRGQHGAGRMWGLLGLTAVGAGGVLGGHLTYAHGAGVYRWQPDRALGQPQQAEAGESAEHTERAGPAERAEAGEAQAEWVRGRAHAGTPGA